MARHLGYKVRDVKKLEARRVKAVARLRRGESTSAVARSLGVGIASVQRWARCYRLHGMEGLRRLPKSGPHPKLARENLAQLPGLLAQGPLAFGALINPTFAARSSWNTRTTPSESICSFTRTPHATFPSILNSKFTTPGSMLRMRPAAQSLRESLS
jgi:transposase